MTENDSTNDEKFMTEDGDLGDFEPETTLTDGSGDTGTPEADAPEADMPTRDAPNTPKNPADQNDEGEVEMEVEAEESDEGGVEWVRVRMNAQRGNGPDQRGDTTVEGAGSDPDEVFDTVKRKFEESVADLEENLGLNDEE